MRIEKHPTQPLLAQLHRGTLSVFDLSSDAPREVATAKVENAHSVVACEAYVAVVTGKVAPAKASLRGAKLERFSWSLAPVGSSGLGEVERHHLSLSADGALAVATDWRSCRVTVFDAATGQALRANGEGIPSGPSFSPTGDRVIAGSADQGRGDILLFDLSGDGMPMEALPPPKGGPGLDDAPYFSRWSRDGNLAALSNETWGGRGVFVYDLERKRPLWATDFPSSSEECDDWFAFPVAFVAGDAVLLVGGPGTLHAFVAADGRELGALDVADVGEDGYVVDEARWAVWTPGPKAHPLPAAWRDPGAAPPARKKAPAKKRQ